jgi:hypothetical protein
MAYFTIQQNKFMKTTNSEGGMRDPEEGASLLKLNLNAASLCACFPCCRTRDEPQVIPSR